MKKRYISLILILALSACTTHEAAVLGAIPGRIIGVPIGMTFTAIEQTFETANDIVEARPKHSGLLPRGYSKPIEYSPRRSTAYRNKNDTHYYKAEVLIKTRGKADFQSVQLVETKDVTDFWQ